MKGFKAIIATLCILFSASVFADTSVAKTMQPVTDASLDAYLHTKMAVMPGIKSANVDVVVNKGVVTLSGTVPTVADASKVVELAASTTGVKDVNAAKLKVAKNVKGTKDAKSDNALGDAIITSKVKGLFVREKLFGDVNVPVTSIKVDTKASVVALSGNVNSEEQATKAVELAKSVSGVTKVNSTVKVVTTVE